MKKITNGESMSSKISAGLEKYWASAAASSRRALDRNKDGKLNRKDISAGIKQLGRKIEGYGPRAADAKDAAKYVANAVGFAATLPVIMAAAATTQYLGEGGQKKLSKSKSFKAAADFGLNRIEGNAQAASNIQKRRWAASQQKLNELKAQNAPSTAVVAQMGVASKLMRSIEDSDYAMRMTQPPKTYSPAQKARGRQQAAAKEAAANPGIMGPSLPRLRFAKAPADTPAQRQAKKQARDYARALLAKTK